MKAALLYSPSWPVIHLIRTWHVEFFILVEGQKHASASMQFCVADEAVGWY